MQSTRNSSKKYTHFVIFAVLSLLWTAFIFSNSLKDATMSQHDSAKVVTFVEKTIEAVFGIRIEESGTNITTENVAFFVRKFAHAFEFAVLGLLAHLALAKLLRNNFALFSLLFTIVVAICDELLQYCSPGRSPQFSDVLIDTLGAMIATVISFSVIKLHERKSSIPKQ